MLARISKAVKMPWAIAGAIVAAAASIGSARRDSAKLPGGKYTPLGKRDGKPAIRPTPNRWYGYTSACVPSTLARHSHSDSSSSTGFDATSFAMGIALNEALTSSSDSYPSVDYSPSSSDSFSGGGGDFGGGGSSDGW